MASPILFLNGQVAYMFLTNKMHFNWLQYNTIYPFFFIFLTKGIDTYLEGGKENEWNEGMEWRGLEALEALCQTFLKNGGIK